MAQTNTFNTRIQHKHDVEANWLKATTFAPKAGELIIYDVDETHSSPRFKVGDGTTLVTNLPFSISEPTSLTDNEIDAICGASTTNITEVNE